MIELVGNSMQVAIIPGLGIQELLVIFGICVVLFGVKKLPMIGKGLGEGIRNFRIGIKEAKTELAESFDELEEESR